MNIKKIKIDMLKPAAYNPRKTLKPGDPEYEKIKNSIMEFGYVEPIVTNKDKTVIGGHQRLSVLKDLDWGEVECVVVDVSKKDEMALNIALNKISGEWDNAKLKDILQELDDGDFNIELTGFEFEEIENMMTQFHVDDTEEMEEEKIKEKKYIECPACGCSFNHKSGEIEKGENNG